MIADALEKLRMIAGDKRQPSFVKDEGGREWTDCELTPNSAPTITALTVSTLGALADLWDHGFEELCDTVDTGDYGRDALMIHVESFESVSILPKNSDKWGRRPKLATAKLPEVKGFEFAKYHNHAAFIIGVSANFVSGTPPENDREYVVQMGSKLTNEKVISSDDDGITQQVGIRQGAVLKATTTLRNRVKLAPYRTFREVEQPSSEFLFRVKQSEGEVPELALFEADGGKWKLDAVENIGRFLRTKLKDTVAIVI